MWIIKQCTTYVSIESIGSIFPQNHRHKKLSFRPISLAAQQSASAASIIMTGNPLKTAVRKVKNEYAQIRAFNRMDLEDIRNMNKVRNELERKRYDLAALIGLRRSADIRRFDCRFEERVLKAEEKHGKIGKFIAQRTAGRGSGHVCGHGVTAIGV